MLKLCVAGAAGKMGNAVIREATGKGHQVVGAVEAAGNVCIGKSLRELGLTDSDTRISGPESVSEAVGNADIYVTFTSPAAEVQNIPLVAGLGKSIILGTTGLNAAQNLLVREAVEGKVPAVFSPNYSIGINVLFRLAKVLTGSRGQTYKALHMQVDRVFLPAVLEEHRTMSATAEHLGITRGTLRARLQALGLYAAEETDVK